MNLGQSLGLKLWGTTVCRLVLQSCNFFLHGSPPHALSIAPEVLGPVVHPWKCTPKRTPPVEHMSGTGSVLLTVLNCLA